MSYLNDPNQEPPSAVGNPRFGPDAFAHYMSQNQVYVDVWDGDSLLHLGVCSVPIKAALRQGRSAIQVDEDVDIIWTELPDDSNQGLPRSSSVASQMSTASGMAGSRKSKMINVGKLHLRMTNIGRSADKVSTQLSYAKDNQKLSLKEEVVIHDYHGAIKHRVDKTITPHRVKQCFSGIASPDSL